MPESGHERRSLFCYYQGRSTLATWLRAVLSQRFVDRVREQKRLAPLTDDEDVPAHLAASRHEPEDPDRPRHLGVLRKALAAAVDRLEPRDRLRLGCYYVQELTLAETGRLLEEHEATVSRQLTRSRRALREDVERQLQDQAKLSEAQIQECFAAASEEAGPLDLRQLLGGEGARKESASDRSI